MADAHQNAGKLLAMLHNMPREPTGELRNPPNDKDYVGLGLTTDEFVAARDALIEASQITVKGDRWTILDLKAVPQGYTHGFDGIPPVEVKEALPRSVEQVAAGIRPDIRQAEVIEGWSGPAKPVPVQAEPEIYEIGRATNGVAPIENVPPAEPAKADKRVERTARPGETGMPPAASGTAVAVQPGVVGETQQSEAQAEDKEIQDTEDNAPRRRRRATEPTE